MTSKRVWLDDVRPAPSGWILCSWPEEVIEHLKTGDVEELSLDHDLGDPFFHSQGYMPSCPERTGYDVLLWIEEQVVLNNFVPPIIHIHSANSAARIRMFAAVAMIKKLHERNQITGE